MTRLEIILEIGTERFYLDTQGIESIPLTFNIANIKDISTTKGSFSKSIKIPETPHNRYVFNNISDLNSVSSFNPNLRNRAYILVDSEMVIEGYFQLSDFTLDLSANTNTMTLVIFTDNNDFYTILGEDYIETLDLSRFDHVWNETNIMHSWTQSYTNGYFYPLIDYGQDWAIDKIDGSHTVAGITGSGIITTGQLYPAIYARTIWDQIFTEAGFSWTSNSLTQSTPFDNLIIPFNNKTPTVSLEYSNQRTFSVGLISDQIIKSADNGVDPSGNAYRYYYYPSNTSSNSIYQPNSWPAPYQSGTYPYGIQTYKNRIKFNDETYPYDDSNGLWNSTLFEYTNNSTYSVTMRFGFDLAIDQLFYYSQQQPPYLAMWRSRNPFSGATISGGYPQYVNAAYPISYNYPVAPPGNGGDWTLVSQVPSGQFGHLNEFQRLQKQFYSQQMNIYPGEKVWVTYNYRMSGQGQYTFETYTPAQAGIVHTRGVSVGATVSKVITGSYMWNEVAASAQVNQIINVGPCIPKNIKKRDFILSLIKMFNLVVEPSKDYPRTLNIETRDYYYANGEVKDWSKKIDLNDQIDVQILADTQNKRTILKYKEDKDFLNTDYKTQTNTTYGEYQYLTDNEFVDGEKKVEVIFSPTPVISLPLTTPTGAIGITVPNSYSASNIIIPKIGNVNNGKFEYNTSNIRILQKGYVTGLPSNQYWKFNNHIMSSYPYSGHLDDVYNPSIDINFGQTQYLYYTQTVVTNQNLYNKYWKKMLDEIFDTDSRIITLSMYLTPYDIINFKFSDNIYLDFGYGGQYYKVNKIENYDPTSIRTCSVELIKTKNITVPVTPKRTIIPRIIESNLIGPISEATKRNTISDPNSVVTGIENNIYGSGIINGNGNGTNGDNILINGDWNTSGSSDVIIFGLSNSVSSNSQYNTIIGNENSISSSVNGAIIMGNNNTVNSGAYSTTSNVFIIGNGMTVNNSNSINMSGILVVNTNFISAGRDEVLNPFSDNSPVNYISGSRDSVRNLGSYNNINIISGGRDTII